MIKAKHAVRIFIIVALLIVNLGCDRLTKTAVRQSLQYNETIGFFNHYVTLTKVENTGAFLSMGHALPQPVRIVVLMALPLLVMAAAIYFLVVSSHISAFTRIGLCCIIGGGMGNLYDRVVFGSVTDFLHINFGIFQTGIFNMADVSIMAGALLILAGIIARKERGLIHRH